MREPHLGAYINACVEIRWVPGCPPRRRARAGQQRASALQGRRGRGSVGEERGQAELDSAGCPYPVPTATRKA